MCSRTYGKERKGVSFFLLAPLYISNPVPPLSGQVKFMCSFGSHHPWQRKKTGNVGDNRGEKKNAGTVVE